MRYHLHTLAGSSFKALLLTRPLLRCQPHSASTGKSYSTWAFWAPLHRAQQLSARVTAAPRRVQLQPDFTRRISGGRLRMSSMETPASPQTQEPFSFGPYRIGLEEVFLITKLSFAFVNLRPVVPDVLVCPKRLVARFADLTAEEVTDLWLTAQRVGEKLEPFFDGSSLTLAIQDGPEAGQTVPHVHVHILPRKKADFKNNDEIYDEIDKKEKELADNLNLDQERKDRTPQVMHEEAAKLRALF